MKGKQIPKRNAASVEDRDRETGSDRETKRTRERDKENKRERETDRLGITSRACWFTANRILLPCIASLLFFVDSHALSFPPFRSLTRF